MGLQDRDYIKEDYSSEFRLETMSVVVRLIVLNVIVFIIDLVFGNGELHIEKDILSISSQTLTHPWMWWQFLTYGFAHGSPTHLAFNMIGLYFFGRELEYHLGKKELLTFYLVAIVFCGVFTAVLHHFQGINSTLLGASGGVMAIIISFCVRFPMVPIIRFPFTIPAWMLGMFYVVMDLGGYLSPSMKVTDVQVAYEAHLAGAAFAVVYWLSGLHLSHLVDNSWLTSLSRRWRRMNSKLQVHRPGEDRAQQDLEDEILAKVHEHGISSLTPKEKGILEEYSRRLRNRLE